MIGYLGGIIMDRKVYDQLKNQSQFDQRQICNILTNQEILQQKQLTEHRKANLANRDFSCMLKK